MSKIYELIVSKYSGTKKLMFRNEESFLKNITKRGSSVVSARIYTISEEMSGEDCKLLSIQKEKSFLRKLRISSVTGDTQPNIDKDAYNLISLLKTRIEESKDRLNFYYIEYKLKSLTIKDQYNFKKVKNLVSPKGYRNHCIKLCKSVEDFEKLLKIHNFKESTVEESFELLRRKDYEECREKKKLFLEAKANIENKK